MQWVTRQALDVWHTPQITLFCVTFLENASLFILGGFACFALEVHVQQNWCFHVLLNLFFSPAHYTWPFFTPKNDPNGYNSWDTPFFEQVPSVRCYFLKEFLMYHSIEWSMHVNLEATSAVVALTAWNLLAVLGVLLHLLPHPTLNGFNHNSVHFALLSWCGWFCWWWRKVHAQIPSAGCRAHMGTSVGE